MSWLGDSLSSFTGHLTNITKEMLNEGREEVGDYATELSVANKQIQDLEGQCNTQKQEMERLRMLNVELEERCQAAELQINAISSQYRTLLQNKEDEINRLKHYQQQNGAAETFTPPPLPSPSADPKRGFDEADLVDLISYQTEINRLAAEVRRLRTDRENWRHLVDTRAPLPLQQNSEDGSENCDDFERAKLQSHIQELEQNLKERIDEHQNQLTVLQDHYATQLRQQQECHHREISTLNENLSFYRQQLDSIKDDGKILETEQIQNKYMETKRMYDKLLQEMEQMKINEKERERKLQLLNSQLNKVQAEKLQLEELHKSAETTISNLQQKMMELQNDHDRFLQNIMSEELLEKKSVEVYQQTDSDDYLELKMKLEEAKKKIEELETEKDKVCNDIYATKLRFLAQLEAHHASTSEVLQDVQAAQQRINEETMDSHMKLLHEKEDIVREMVHINEQKVGLEKQLRSLQKNNSALALDIKKIIESLGSKNHCDISDLIAKLDSETSTLKSYNMELSNCLSNLDRNSSSQGCEIANDQQPDNKRSENFMADIYMSDDFDGESMTSSMSELSMRNKELDEQVKGLQSQIENYEREIKYFELLHSDWQTERKAMEDLLLGLRAQLRMKEESLSVITAEKGLIAVKKKRPNDVNLHLPPIEAEELDNSDNLLEKLEEQIEELMQINAQFENEKEVLKAENNALLEELSTLRNFQQSFDSKLDVDKSLLIQMENTLTEKESQISVLNSEKESLENSLIELDKQHQEEIQEFVNLKMTLSENNKKLQTEIKELKTALEISQSDNSLLKTEVETVKEQLTALLEVAGKKNTSNENSERSTETVQSILNAFQTINLDNINLEENITSLEENRKQLEETIRELERKNKNLQIENEEFSIEIKDLKETEKRLRDEKKQLIESLQDKNIIEESLCKFKDLEQNSNLLKEENYNLTRELESQKLKYNEITKDNLDILEEKVKFENLLQENNKELEKFKAELVQKDDEIQVLKEILNSTKRNCFDKSSQVDLTFQNVEELENELKTTQQKLLNCTKKLDLITENNFHINRQVMDEPLNNNDIENWKEKYFENQEKNLPNEEQKNNHKMENKELYEFKESLNSMPDKENTYMLEKIISDQKQQIENLKLQFQMSNHSSKSTENWYEDSKFKTLQEKIQQLEIEKEQMLSVLNEKSRECSNLKNEVHRLVNIVSAEKQAISKLQEDNRELIKQKDDPDQEMTKEAVQNLCRLVRDKDLEIEALSQKNNTLLTVIQQSSDNDYTRELLKESETLIKQLNAYKADREQIIDALNKKHQESMKYHAEVQKLKSLLATETHKLNTLTHNHESVSQQYEEKQKSLVNTQNEVIGLKQRVSDLEKQHADLEQKYRELLDTEDRKIMANITKEELNKNFDEMEKLKNLVEEKEKWIFEKDHLIHELSHDVQKLSDNLKQKDNEVGILQKQTENLVSHLKETKDETSSIRERNQNLQQQLSNFQSEMNLMKELNERLNMTVQEKDFEIQALQEKINSLTPIVQEKTNEEANMKRILTESNAMQQKAQHFHHERDEALLALSQRQQENEDLKNETQRLREREKHLNSELERLRDHLLQVEESYTKDALKAEEREKDLRNRLNQAEEQATLSSTAIHNANHHANMQMESLQEQLILIVKQRDRAQNQISEYEDKVQQYAASLANLQLVLEQFQKERERDIQTLKRHHQTELANEKQKVQDLLADIWEKEEQLSEAKEALNAASRLSEQLDSKEEIINSLRQEVSKLTASLQKALQEITDLKSNTEGRVDRQVMKSLVLGYFSAPLGQKSDVIRLLARVLDFNQEEMLKAGIKVGRENNPTQVNTTQKTGSWISGLFGKSSQNSKQETRQKKDEKETNKSFTALFIQFLQDESQPQLQIKLPAEEMAKELTRKTNPQTRPPRINPFNSATPMLPSSSISDLTHKNLDHPLIRPISSSLPAFTPILVATDEGSSKSNTFLQEVLN